MSKGNANNSLLTLYEMAEGEANREVDTKQLAERMKIDYGDEASKLGRYWHEEAKVDWGSFDRVFLTPTGRATAERLIETNKQQANASFRLPVEMTKCPQCGQYIRATA